MEDLQYLELEKDYEFEVRVKDENTFFAGNLKLTNSKCTLSVMTERNFSEGFTSSTFIECFTIKYKFIIYGLKIIERSSNFLARNGNEIVGFEKVTFEISFVVFSKCMSFKNNNLVYNFQLFSSKINEWIGVTKNQVEFFKDSNEFELMEFSTDILNDGELSCNYTKIQDADALKLSYGAKLLPNLCMNFFEPRNLSDSLNEILKFYDFFTLLIGGDFKVDCIKLLLNLDTYQDVSIYFSDEFVKKMPEWVILPLGHNLVNNIDDIQPLELTCFSNFYALKTEKQDVFSKYIRYKRLNSNEEKFLGYFRLLESLTYHEDQYLDNELLAQFLSDSESNMIEVLNAKRSTIKDFSKRIIRLNKSKLNTESCIRRYYNSLPGEIKNLIDFNIKELNNVTKLRNDITHANPYEVNSEDFIKYIKFVHLMLYLSLVNLVGISYNTCMPVISRINRRY
ncbi:hypothetical protein EA770_07065 [Acinetobacter baumannii]|nr:hypothetical protein EA770_07065 [Acinetobacter baumannii]